jgi:peptide/nickel transport system permease protein
MSPSTRVFAPPFAGDPDEMSPSTLEPAKAGRSSPRSFLARLRDSDLVASFFASKTTLVAGLVTLILVLAAVLAPLIAPTNPFNPATNFLIDSLTPPRFVAGGDPRFLLGTDDQGRDMASAILYGLRVSLTIGVLSVLLGGAIGITLGLIAGYAGGWLDAVIMRVADVQLTFPAILIALLLDGVAQALLKNSNREQTAFGVLVVAIGLSFWVQYARTVRGSTMVEKNRDYVQAARLIGLSPARVLLRHILPNVMGPVLVIATINLAIAIITEATLSFLGVGLPPTQPSLGTLIRIGQNFLFSGEWWIVAFPSLTLAILVLAVNLLGDWLRDALNPRLK